ncbi:FAD-dependent monooxygenase [Nonomuraea sp. SBT364]|uniref:FAD-dependent monooxygenase n=1 Tax=Nonomuraea sp. SBT364 TaxID=1580530 RepID=UPI00066B6AAF|nr:FAD-dependent monooxygenase [Nonomuraea sp. SBT364]
MQIACVGGGPASLYFSILMKQVAPSHDITVYERNRDGSTYGWGVTFWGDLLDGLLSADPESARAIKEGSFRWDSWVMNVHDRSTLTGDNWDEGFGIGRRELLAILAERARSLGVRVEYEREITGQDELAGADLIVAGDGAGSVLRERHAAHFGTEVTTGRNPYVWLGTTKVFDAFTFAFTETEHGWIWCYGYGYGADRSTCVIECFPETWRGLGLHEANEADTLALLEKLFADILDGHPLIGRGQTGAHWLNFRTLSNRTWHRGNLVLLGDAAHTTHYSIGAGTALALEDAMCLVDALQADKRLQPALDRFGRDRRASIRLAQRDARYSARWYESLTRYIDLPPLQMHTLRSRRHSWLLPHVPPRLYYRSVRLGSRAARLIPARRASG